MISPSRRYHLRLKIYTTFVAKAMWHPYSEATARIGPIKLGKEGETNQATCASRRKTNGTQAGSVHCAKHTSTWAIDAGDQN